MVYGSRAVTIDGLCESMVYESVETRPGSAVSYKVERERDQREDKEQVHIHSSANLTTYCLLHGFFCF